MYSCTTNEIYAWLFVRKVFDSAPKHVFRSKFAFFFMRKKQN